MVTYADMLTLLLVLFIVMFAMANVDKTKFDSLKSSLASAFHSGNPSILTSGSGLVGGATSQTNSVNNAVNQPIASNNIQNTQYIPLYDAMKADAAKKEFNEFKKIEKSVETSLAQRGFAGNAQFTIDERGLVITIITDDLVFGGNSAVLEAKGHAIIDAVIPPLRGIDNKIQVDGHTNQANVSTAPYPSGWELSSARASSVVRYLIEQGFAAKRLSAVGYSDQRPLVDPKNPLSVTRNRRVDLVVLSKFTAASAPEAQTGSN
jgi:chemotaxis protein MotB